MVRTQKGGVGYELGATGFRPGHVNSLLPRSPVVHPQRVVRATARPTPRPRSNSRHNTRRSGTASVRRYHPHHYLPHSYPAPSGFVFILDLRIFVFFLSCCIHYHYSYWYWYWYHNSGNSGIQYLGSPDSVASFLGSPYPPMVAPFLYRHV